MTGHDTHHEYDVVVLGEVLVEVSTEEAFADAVPARIGFSGDALNVAAAAAAAGARVGLVTVVADDELGGAVVRRVGALGISTDLIVTRPGQQGVYFVHSDPAGEREFSYARTGSAGSTLSPGDVDTGVLRDAGAVIASGITCALSDTARQAVFAAAEATSGFIFDPNFRARLTTARAAQETLEVLAPLSWVMTPSHPGETAELLGAHSARTAADTLRGKGAEHVAVTCGAEGVHLLHPGGAHWIDSVPAPALVDQTGAGDSFVGTLGARMALGEGFENAALLGTAAASLAVGGRGGTGVVPTLDRTREHAVHRGPADLRPHGGGS
ncbi:PfkB family carbohydrate kinase [Nocardiopsis salina]|uniref:PfkB family carbohydrate kinase n=1 Tax=Nocardiopsis salina TaxID=245836 RepID=UPI00034C7E7D|nr:PfkB family carbohydrate kinase [Nocardiopsis salina]